MEASTARGAGVDPEDPPLRWEVSAGDGRWEDAEVLEDLTGGFNYGSGTVELQCPPRSAVEPLAGKRLRWLRCRIDEKTRTGGEHHLHPPAGDLLDHRRAGRRAAGGVALRARRERGARRLRRHARRRRSSCATPRCSSRAGSEHLEVQDPESGDWERWELRENFVDSTPFERHYTLDVVSGEIELGPAIRETDGGWSQYGAVPPKGAIVRMNRYRYGGGRDGNVAAGTLNVLRSPIPGIDTVTNPVARDRRRRRRAARARARARRDGDPHALPRGDRRGLRVPGRRGVAARRARGLPGAERRRPGAAADPPARVPRRPPAALRGAGARRDAAARRRRVPRRAPADRHAARAAARAGSAGSRSS